MKKFSLLMLFAILSIYLTAQQLIPFQVQDGASWGQNKPWGYKDQAFNVVIKPINERMNLFSNGYCVLYMNKRYGLMDKTGRVVLPVIYNDCSDVQGNYVVVQDSSSFTPYVLELSTQRPLRDLSKAGRIKLSGVPGLFIVETTRQAKSGNLLMDDKTKRFGLINPQGTYVLPAIYKSIYKSDENFLKIVDTLDNYGFVDLKGKWIVKPAYKSIGRIREGMAFFKGEDKKYGFMDQAGKVIAQPVYDNAGDFQNGYAFVTLNKETFLLDKKGKPLFKGKGYKNVVPVSSRYFKVTAANDSLYLVDAAAKQLNNSGAKYLASLDGSGVLYGAGGKLYYQSGDAVKTIDIPNVSGVSATSTGFYQVYTRLSDTRDSRTLLTKDLQAIVTQDKTFWYSEDPVLGLTYKYFYPNNGSMILISYLDKTGRPYTEHVFGN